MKKLKNYIEKNTKIIDGEEFLKESLSNENIEEENFDNYDFDTDTGIVVKDCNIEIPSYLTKSGIAELVRYTKIETFENGILVDEKIEF